MKDGCIFCRIAAGEIPCNRVDESERALAFRDIDPKAPAHILIVSKEHITSAADVGAAHAALLGDLFEMAARIARKERLDRGWRLVTNVGPDGGQSVDHLHLHLLGGRPLHWPPG